MLRNYENHQEGVALNFNSNLLMGLHQCLEKIRQWEKFKSDYEVLKERLETLPNALSYDVTIPFGTQAFTTGKLVHTNEIMVLLGDDWFAEVSAKEASAIASRRILQCLKMLEECEKEKLQFENWLKYINEVTNSEGLVDIREEYDEEKEKEWRDKHAESLKEYRRQRTAEEKSHQENQDGSKMLEECNNKKTNFESSLKSINGGSGDDDLIDIMEEYDEEEEKKWRAKHAESLKEYRRQTIAEKKNHQEDPVSCNSDDAFAEILNNLEINEADSNDVESDRNTTEYSDECSQNSEEHFKPPLKLLINCNNRKSFSESETGDDVEDCSKRKDDNANTLECNSPSSSKHVRWVDLSKQNMKKITFKHSKSKKHDSSHRRRSQDSFSESDDPSSIQSPSDIYKHFGSYFQMSPPKSILKVKQSPTSDYSEPSFQTKENMPKSSSPDTNDESSYPAFTGEVIERSSPVKITESKSRPSSHFKNSRKNRKH
ncbi:unconventional prefoldin RPB5 interactor 1-like isoform X2 [Uloborus diversus]|uniref:unconventional prefoldin RPB5 interactor 1-like isoform X2 n=1 Tax=Uloborus diversus TaxID=327109 RepID=UPI00240A83B6|nr:unconventional prefoldin RPB5 interactor 1-like isoform X2 [Uloborus diversus]